MTLLYNTAQIRQIEAAHATTHPKISLMQRAGEAVAAQAIKLLDKRKKTVLVLVGAGNNGGDGWVAARALQKQQKQKIKVTVLALSAQIHKDAAAKKAHSEYKTAKGIIALEAAPVLGFDNDYGLIIDGIFGIGLVANANRKSSAKLTEVIRAANALSAKHNIPVLAIDIPSGLIADTGEALGEFPSDCIQATTTITFLGAKPGLYTADGVDCCGEIIVDSLGVQLASPSGLPETLPRPLSNGALLTETDCAALVPQRRRNSHKGSYGNVGIIGGADGMVGAAVLAARAALHMGPGKVYVGLMAKTDIAFDTINPEIMVRPARDLATDPTITAFAIGMGMGNGMGTGLGTRKDGIAKKRKLAKIIMANVMTTAAANGRSVLIDADALQLISLSSSQRKKTSTSSAGAALQAQSPRDALPASSLKHTLVLTPHPGEAARLLDITTANVQKDRIGVALKIAALANAIVVLKGAGTVIAAPPIDGHPGRYFINTTGNPGMASGGMGDALSGMIAAFMAQGLPTLDAAKLGVYLHGAAADAACHHAMGPNGLTASEVIFEARSLLNSGLADHHD